jgi:nitroreductase
LNVIDAVKFRRSVRDFSEKKLESNKLVKILEAARLAPSAFNRQEWRFVLVKDAETIKKLVTEAKSPPFVSKAPVVIVACAKSNGPVMSCGQPCYVIDVAIALDHLSLAAVEYGIGSCWVSLFDETKVREILRIPDEVRVIALMPLGYPLKPLPSDKKRLPLAQLVRFDIW